MLATHTLQLLREQIETDLATKATPMRKLQTRAAEKGHSTGNVGNMAMLFARAYMEEIELRVALIASAIRTVLTDVRVRPYETLTDDLLSVFDSACSGVLAEYRPRLVEALKNGGFGDGDGGTEEDIQKYLLDHRMNVKRLAAAIMEPIRQGEQTVITISNSQVGLVQSGANHTTSGHFSISQNDTTELRRTLESLREVLANHPGLHAERRGEVVEIVQDIEAEISKSMPNKTKTGGLLSTLMASLRGISDIEKASQVLSKVAELLGYHLL